MKLRYIILIIIILIIGYNIIATKNFNELEKDIKENFLQENQNVRHLCEDKKMNNIGVVINNKGYYEAVCNTESPYKIYRFNMKPITEN